MKALEQNEAGSFFSQYRLLATRFQYLTAEQQAETRVAELRNSRSAAYTYADAVVKRHSGVTLPIAEPPTAANRAAAAYLDFTVRINPTVLLPNCGIPLSKTTAAFRLPKDGAGICQLPFGPMTDPTQYMQSYFQLNGTNPPMVKLKDVVAGRLQVDDHAMQKELGEIIWRAQFWALVQALQDTYVGEVLHNAVADIQACTQRRMDGHRLVTDTVE